MHFRPLAAMLSLALAFGGMADAHAQSLKKRAPHTTVLPVLNKDSGKVEAVLELQPTGQVNAGARWKFGSNSIDAAFGLSSGDSLGLLCNSSGGGASITTLASRCMLASVGGKPDAAGNGARASVGTTFSRPGGRLTLSAGTERDTLPAWLTGNGAASGHVQQNDLTVYGRKSVGREGFVSIGGTVAHARLIPLADAPIAVANQWDSKSFSVGGGYGAFSANVIGRVVDAPGNSSAWQGLGLGITWRTPWSGQLTIGAENVITRGKNPFAPNASTAADGTVPYVRYEQDL